MHPILERLQKVRPSGYGKFMACCPAHEDRSPSLSVRVEDNGKVLLHCFAGCPPEDVVEAVGMRMMDLAPRDFEPTANNANLSHERMVLLVAESNRAAGKILSKDDLERERIAYLKTRGA